MKKRNIQLLLLFSSFLAFSCSSGEEKNEAKELISEADSVVNSKGRTEEAPIKVQKLKMLTHSIPSPIEVANIIKNSGGNYSKTNLNAPKNAKQYQSRFKQALNLGVYSADLTLASMYNQHQDALTYLSSINKLSELLEIDHLFDMKVIEKLLKNSNNLDSLLTISTSNFEKINLYLHSQNQSQETTLILTGGWIEGLYQLSKIQKEISSEQLSEKIGEQKFVLEQLLKILNTYEEEEYKALHEDMKKLYVAYEDVIIETTQGHAEFKELNGMIMVTTDAIQHVDISEETLENITVQLNQIRKNIIRI